MLRDLSHLKSIPAHFKAVEHLDNSIWTPETDSDIKSMSSIKALIKGRVVFEEVTKFGALHVLVYSMMTFIPARKRMIEMVQPAKIPFKCWCQLLSAFNENDLLHRPI